jgi:hypothetical protein
MVMPINAGALIKPISATDKAVKQWCAIGDGSASTADNSTIRGDKPRERCRPIKFYTRRSHLRLISPRREKEEKENGTFYIDV